MNPIDQIRKALEAGPEAISTELYGDRYFGGDYSCAQLSKAQDDFITACTPSAIAALLASHDAAVQRVAEMQERCARVCDFLAVAHEPSSEDFRACAAAIRAIKE